MKRVEDEKRARQESVRGKTQRRAIQRARERGREGDVLDRVGVCEGVKQS